MPCYVHITHSIDRVFARFGNAARAIPSMTRIRDPFSIKEKRQFNGHRSLETGSACIVESSASQLTNSTSSATFQCASSISSHSSLDLTTLSDCRNFSRNGLDGPMSLSYNTRTPKGPFILSVDAHERSGSNLVDKQPKPEFGARNALASNQDWSQLNRYATREIRNGVKQKLSAIEKVKVLGEIGSFQEAPEMKSPVGASEGERRQCQPWQVQKKGLLEKFGSSSWLPRKRLSPDALEGLRTLHAQHPQYTTPVLADLFKVSPEAIRRILKSKWRPSQEEEERRRQRWNRRGEGIWRQKVELGIKAPRKWRDMGLETFAKLGSTRTRRCHYPALTGMETKPRGGIGSSTDPRPVVTSKHDVETQMSLEERIL